MDGDASSSSHQSGVDVKYLDRPKEFHNDEARWKDWKFKLCNWMSLLEVRFSTLLDAAEQADREVPSQARDDMQRLQHTLYAVLASVLTGKSLKILQAVKDRNGLEAWRRVCSDFEPRVVQRRLAMLTSIMNPGFGQREAEFSERWTQWNDFSVYEDLTGKVFDRDIMLAVVVDRSPAETRQHLQLNASQYENSYPRLKAILTGYL